MMNIKMLIQTLNQKLVDENVDISIIDYVKLLNENFYNMDISFIDDFIGFVDKDECCIHHDMLIKYGVLSLTSGTVDVKRIIDQQKIESDTSAVRKTADRTNSNQLKNNYYFHPRLFKLILIRSRNNDTYAKYYIFLEEALKHYSYFQIMKLEYKLNKRSTISILKLFDKDTLDRFIMAKNINNK